MRHSSIGLKAVRCLLDWLTDRAENSPVGFIALRENARQRQLVRQLRNGLLYIEQMPGRGIGLPDDGFQH
jgi:hypothetical protein